MAGRYEPLKVEDEIISLWDENHTYETIKNRNAKGKKFYFLDGPPYTSGKVHLGTAWNKSLKDSILRYKRMKGFDVWDRAGYDMHGLPTEHATEKKLKLEGKEDIKRYGIAKFIAECKSLCIDNMKLMNKDFQRLGVWMDFDNAYQSITNDFIDGEWWLIKKADENGRLYRGFRTMTWCKDCATALAKHELEYEEVKDTSIFVKFKVKGKSDEYLIVWTTTPWTIPFNMAIMVNPGLDYIRVKVEDEIWILSRDLGPMVISAVIGKKFEELEVFKGEKLQGIQYEHFFDQHMNYKQIEARKPENVHSVILSEEYVDTSAGTGLVHCAPGCGPEDYEVGYRNGIPAFNSLNEQGVFPGSSGIFSGLIAKKDDEQFIELIRKSGALLATTEVEHDYAHCWRCKNGVIYRTTKQWFFKVEDIKDKMISENQKIKWVPETAFNAFNSWLSNLRDNSISKQRYWGTPIPIWVNEKDETDYIVVGSVKELESLSGQKVAELHIPDIDNIAINKDGKRYIRTPDILDVWVDAGTTSWNCLYFPHRKDLMDNLFPAEFILEGKDQIRGWFNLLHVASMVSMGKPSFKKVYMHGFVQDSQGRKMSKSLGNYILPEEIISKYGADTFRYYFIGGANPGLDINYNPEDVDLKFKNLNVLWNVHTFTLDFFENSGIKFNSLDHAKMKFEKEDLYMLSYLNSKIRQASLAFEEYRLNEVPLIIENLYLELSRGYIQLVREKAVQGTDSEKEAIAYVLGRSMLDILAIFATIAPFVTEKIYQSMKHLYNLSNLSIHEFGWPEYDPKMIDESLEKDMSEVYSLIQGILFAREKAQLGVRWPVLKIYVATKKPEIRRAIESLKDMIMNQTNAKDIIVTESLKEVKSSFKPDMGKIGRSFGEKTHKIASALANVDQTSVLTDIETKNKYNLHLDGKDYEIISEHITIERSVPANLQEAEFKQGFVYLDKTRTPELEAEGMTREIVRRIQALRKKEGMQKAESIELYLRVPEELVDAVGNYEKNIKLITGSKGIMISTNSPEKSYDVQSKEKIKSLEIDIYFQRLEQ